MENPVDLCQPAVKSDARSLRKRDFTFKNRVSGTMVCCVVGGVKKKKKKKRSRGSLTGIIISMALKASRYKKFTDGLNLVKITMYSISWKLNSTDYN
jgi:hypothetical protein